MRYVLCGASANEGVSQLCGGGDYWTLEKRNMTMSHGNVRSQESISVHFAMSHSVDNVVILCE